MPFLISSSPLLQEHLQLNLVTDRDTVRTRERYLRLQAARIRDGVSVHPHQREASLLPKAQGSEIVVGCDQPKAFAAGLESGLADSLHESGADTLTFSETVQGDDFTGVPFDPIGGQACPLLVIGRNIAGESGRIVKPSASHLESGYPMLAKESLSTLDHVGLLA